MNHKFLKENNAVDAFHVSLYQEHFTILLEGCVSTTSPFLFPAAPATL